MRHLFMLFQWLVIAITVQSCCCPHRLMPSAEPAPLEPFYVPERIRVALVLGSGGVRGMAHVGVLEVFEEYGIPIDLIVGCSAGSIVGALYAEKCSVAAIKPCVMEMRTHSMMDIECWNIKYGLSQGDSMHKVIDKYLEAEDFCHLNIPFVCCAADLHSGELIPMGSGDLISSIRASCSIPFVFVPCELNGRILVDGGTINPNPANIAHDLGAEIVICVDLCELLEKTFPTNLFTVATRAAEIAFMWQNETCTSCADVTIRPKTCGVGSFNDKMKWKVYQAGREAALEKIPEILELLSRIPPDCTSDLTRRRLVCMQPYVPGIYRQES